MQGAGLHPLVGQPVPAFTLSNQFGEDILSASIGRGNAFLVFFPFAFSRICTGELAALERMRAELGRSNIGIFGISVDHKYALRAYAAEQGIGFDLLADFWPHGEVARAFGCFDEAQGRALRSTFLITAGRVAHHFSSDAGEARRDQDYRDALVLLAG